MDIDSRYRDPRNETPSPILVSDSAKDAVSPVLIGRMYEITKYNDPDRNKWAVKILRPEIADSSLYPGRNLEQIFDEHIAEHELFVECLGDFIEPSEFYKEISPDGTTQYCTIQPWIEDGVQYKEAVKSGRRLSKSQFPDMNQRVEFIEGLAILLSRTNGKLPDLDFFISRKNDKTSIRIFDTTGFWPEKRGGKDRNEMVHNLRKFLFTEEELSNLRISKVFDNLAVRFDYFS